MSRIFMDGFESGGLDLFSSSSSAFVIAARTGFSGNYCLDLSGASDWITLSVAEGTEYYIAFKWEFAGIGTNCNLVSFYNGATFLGSAHINTGGGVTLRGGATILQESSLGSLVGNGILYLIEVHYKLADAGGAFEIKINGVSVVSFSGDTKIVAPTTVTGMRFGNDSADYSKYSFCYIDDLIIDDANWIGPTSIQGLAPTGAGATTGFTPSTGSNYACVDETPPSDIDFVYTNTPNVVDTYALGNLTGTINSIKAVQVQARCMQEGSPATTKIQLVTRPASTDRVSASKTVQTFAPKSVFNIWELNPEDSAAWEEADVNGMEIGVKAVAS
jgi:hypothetical protein